MVIKEESGLKFGFPEKSIVIKFDDTLFYRDYFNRFPGSKGIANSHFLRTAGPHSPDSPGHIKRTVLEISRAERGLRPANQYRALSQKAMPSQSVR